VPVPAAIRYLAVLRFSAAPESDGHRITAAALWAGVPLRSSATPEGSCQATGPPDADAKRGIGILSRPETTASTRCP
jgi:hypothetical protein